MSPPWPQTTPKNGPACQTTTILRTTTALQDRGIKTKSVSTREEALKLLAKKIPPGAEVMTGASATLDEIGFLQLLKLGTHQWKNLKTEITGEKDPVRQRGLRVRATAAQYFVGSAHAIAETGEIVVASASGSQIPAYAYSSNNVIWVVGAQKIVASLDEGSKASSGVLPANGERQNEKPRISRKRHWQAADFRERASPTKKLDPDTRQREARSLGKDNARNISLLQS